MLHLLELPTLVLFCALLSYYLVTNLQWYGYKLQRVFFHHKRCGWHIAYFFIPLALYYSLIGSMMPVFTALVWLVYLPLLIYWARALDKRLSFTWRVRRFFAIFGFLCLAAVFVKTVDPALCIGATLLLSSLVERLNERRFVWMAASKLESIGGLKVVAVTASFGKTSIKHHLAHILASKFSVYATPGSVNTLMGVVRDINERLPFGTQVYVVEAGARREGDILEIAQLVRPHYAVVGKLGAAHLEYFKNFDTIRRTKLELLRSDRLLRAFVFENANYDGEKTVVFGMTDGEVKIESVNSSLEGISFTLNANARRLALSAPRLLGSFQAINIAAAALVAREMGMDDEAITQAVRTLQPTPHRLQKIESHGKLIIDDSFNGNFDGMMEGVRLASTFGGKKVIVTPGLVETDPKLNRQLAQEIDVVFDLVIITGVLNAVLFDETIKRAQKIMLSDKKEMTTVLAQHTSAGDLIYFANDAPNFI